MALIDFTYFQGELTIGQLESTGVQEALPVFIAKYEKELLVRLFGKTLYDEFMAGLGVDPIDAKWVSLRNALVDPTLKVSPIANYVYYWYIRNQATHSVGTGIVKANVVNGEMASVADKTTKAWNDMVVLNREFYDWIIDKDYNYEINYCSSLYQHINSIGL